MTWRPQVTSGGFHHSTLVTSISMIPPNSNSQNTQCSAKRHNPTLFYLDSCMVLETASKCVGSRVGITHTLSCCRANHATICWHGHQKTPNQTQPIRRPPSQSVWRIVLPIILFVPMGDARFMVATNWRAHYGRWNIRLSLWPNIVAWGFLSRPSWFHKYARIPIWNP